MHLSHNLDPDELSLALSGIILSEGIEDSVLDTLQKSRRGGGEKAQEPEFIELVSRWKRTHRNLLSRLRSNLDLWVDMKQSISKPGTFGRIWPFFSRPHVNLPLRPTLNDIIEASWLIYDHYKQSAGYTQGFWEAPQGEEWARAGLEVPSSDLSNIASEAYLAGRGGSHIFLPGIGNEASRYAAIHAGAFITGIGSRMSNRALQRSVDVLAGQYQGTISFFLTQRFRREFDTPENSWQELSKILRSVIGDSDFKRDMDRVAATELRWAYNTGRIQQMVERGYQKVYYVVQSNACSVCKRLLLDPSGKPKVFPLKNILQDIVTHGGMNAFRDEEHYKPTASIHPHCHCQLMPYED